VFRPYNRAREDGTLGGIVNEGDGHFPTIDEAPNRWQNRSMTRSFHRADDRDFSADKLDVRREALAAAMKALGPAEEISAEDREALIGILRQLASLEPFRKPEHMAAIAVEWYRSRR
jgi:hypothetical protein